ncbi:hypothetical protein ACGF0J_14545 [Nonomuraea sp. NPDC047897]|uniref:hypothetical protein n=1 Tax=Nonomuraea sp. NPDC047897 TaxID=3364346 RepID=UPI003715E6B3
MDLQAWAAVAAAVIAAIALYFSAAAAKAARRSALEAATIARVEKERREDERERRHEELGPPFLNELQTYVVHSPIANGLAGLEARLTLPHKVPGRYSDACP